MTIFDLLTTMQDINLDLHLYKNYTQGDGETKMCEEIESIQGTNNEVFIKLNNKKYHQTLINVFYIGYNGNRSRVLRVNAEVLYS